MSVVALDHAGGGAIEVDVAALVGDNLRRLRTRNGLSLERLARASGVSRAMLGQVELGRSIPTIAVLWKVARALNVPLATFLAAEEPSGPKVMRGHRARWLTSANGRFSARALFPADQPRQQEFFEIRLAAHGLEEEAAHPPGTVANLVVARGAIDVRVDGEWHRLEAGDAIHFLADGPHAYRNVGLAEAGAFIVLAFAERRD